VSTIAERPEMMLRSRRNQLGALSWRTTCKLSITNYPVSPSSIQAPHRSGRGGQLAHLGRDPTATHQARNACGALSSVCGARNRAIKRLQVPVPQLAARQTRTYCNHKVSLSSWATSFVSSHAARVVSNSYNKLRYSQDGYRRKPRRCRGNHHATVSQTDVIVQHKHN
jgi:hypothetical protein